MGLASPTTAAQSKAGKVSHLRRRAALGEMHRHTVRCALGVLLFCFSLQVKAGGTWDEEDFQPSGFVTELTAANFATAVDSMRPGARCRRLVSILALIRYCLQCWWIFTLRGVVTASIWPQRMIEPPRCCTLQRNPKCLR